MELPGSGGAARGRCWLPPAEPHELAPRGAGWPLRILSGSGRDWCAAPRGASVSLRYFSAGRPSGWSSDGRNVPGDSQDAAGSRGADRRDTSARTELTPASKPRQSSDPSCHPKDVPSTSPCSAPTRKRSRVACGEAVKACGQTGGQTAAPEPRGLPSPEPQGPRSHWPRVGSRGGRGEAGPAAQPCVSPHDATRRPGPVPGDTALERIYLLKCVMCYRSLGNIRGILLLIQTSSDGSLTTCFLGCCLSVVDL